MAAPNFAGDHPHSAAATDHEQHNALSDEGGPQDTARSERIAELMAQLAAIESRDRSASFSEPAAPRSGTDGRAAGSGETAAAWSVAPASSAGEASNKSAGPIGSSGTTRSTRRFGGEAGGHPEDDPGDPEAVARAVCLRLLTGAARPRAGLETALRLRGIPDDVAAKVLDRFTEVGLIDDKAYAEAFVAAKHRERALGVTALRTELRRKGVDEQTVDAAVQAVDHDAERQRAKALISRRVDAAMDNGAATARRRLVGLLARRGYSAELACQVVDEALAEYGAEEQDGWSD